MSIASDCPSCMQGQHKHHNERWGLTPGLIGGTYCDCPGDCAARFAQTAVALRASLSLLADRIGQTLFGPGGRLARPAADTAEGDA